MRKAVDCSTAFLLSTHFDTPLFYFHSLLTTQHYSASARHKDFYSFSNRLQRRCSILSQIGPIRFYFKSVYSLLSHSVRIHSFSNRSILFYLKSHPFPAFLFRI